MNKFNIVKKFLFWLFKIFVLPVIQEKIEEKVTDLVDHLIKSKYNTTTVADIDDLKWHTRDALTEFSESWLDE